MSASASSILELLELGAGDAPALSIPGGIALSYQGLRDLVGDTLASLNQRGIGRNDRVAIVLDNGAEMAAAFVSIAAAATAAPLNPGYRTDEFHFYLSDLRAKLLVIESGKASPAVEVAQSLNIPVARLVARPERGAGCFELHFPQGYVAGTAAGTGASAPEDVALVLHTSGTTSRPKLVPLKQRNICASARHIRHTLAFRAEDRGLNIMPLFHIHGLIAGLLAPLSAGGEICCTPGFSALKFFGWMEQVQPTWYTGVPTMHQAILARAARNAQTIKANPLRFIRSSSASMPAQVIRELEQVFDTVVIEAYSMTEAAHQMTSNSLPPGRRRPGSVGVAAGPEVCVLDAAGNQLPPGITGEVAIRGPNVMSGYENNPQANAQAFVNGWFRTGDQGVMDAEGYLTLSGRLKEIIIRGGEKISPREVDEVLMDHPAVQQCLTFAVPHEKLGEDVAAVIVLRESAIASEDQLREFAAARLADFKVPRRIIFRDEIPKGATGKPQRIGLAQKLGLA